MREKNILGLIVIVAVIIVASIAGIFYITSSNSYKNVTIDGVVCEVPDNGENITVKEVASNYHIYEDPKNNLTIIVYNQIENQTQTDDNNTTNTTNYEDQFIQQKNSVQTGSSMSKEGMSFNKTNNDIYSYYGNYSGKNVLIKTANENVIVHILKSLQVTPLQPQIAANDTNDTNNTTTTDTKVVTKTKVVHVKDSDNDKKDNDTPKPEPPEPLVVNNSSPFTFF